MVFTFMQHMDPLPASGSSKEEMGSSSPKHGQPLRQFTISEIRSATRDFRDNRILAEGDLGKVYKALIGTTYMAVKRWNSKGAPEFKAELQLLPMLQHPNILCLIGYCTEGEEMILAYEFMYRGSLESHLRRGATFARLLWSQRLKICVDVARALDYLHNGTSGQVVIYNNLKCSNILLDIGLEAKLSDFGLSKIISSSSPSTGVSTAVIITGDNPSTRVSTEEVAGITRYIDPEYLATGRLSNKSDVYSFGVVLLEVLSSRYRTMALTGFNAKAYMRKGKSKWIIDPELKEQISRKCLNEYVRIAEGCLREGQEQRVTMAEVVFGLESILASYEKTDGSIPQMGITTSHSRLQNISSSRHNSGGSYFGKVTRLLSAKFLRHKGDHGHMPESVSETDVSAISEESHHTRFSDEDYDEAIEPSRDFSDEPFYELFVFRAGKLVRMKDFLHLLWFYPMKKEAELHFGSLLYKFSSLNQYIRKPLDSSRDDNNLMEIETLLQDIKEHLDDAAFDMVAYLPYDLVQNRSGSAGLENLATGVKTWQGFWSGIPEVHTRAVALATHRAVSCIKDMKVKKLGISGSGDEEVARTLKDMPELRRVFDMVLCVRVKYNSIGELMGNIQREIYMWIDRNSETDNKLTVLDRFKNCLLFVDCSGHYINLHGPEFDLSRWFGSVQIVMTGGSQDAYCLVDMEIRVEDQLLPWILFSENVDLATVSKYTSIQEMAANVIEKCHGHLLAIILLARALKGMVDVGVWELALQELTSQKEPSSSSQLGLTSDVMVRVLRFIWPRMETLSQRCIGQFASHYIGELDRSSLISSWIGDGLVKGEQEGEHVFEDLICSFLLERVGENCVRMRDETRVILLAYIVSPAYRLYLKLDGSVPNQMPNVEEWDAWEIQLSNNIISELPDNPNCPILVKLFLHFNQDLIDIPITFFKNMPGLQVLDLSSTSIYCLPSSISKLTTLRELFIRHCDSLRELPPEIGSLKNLKVFDSEGTQLICLPWQFRFLTKLKCLKFSLYDFADRQKQSDQSMQTKSASVLSKLIRLKELSICVGLYREWWEDEVKLIIDILPKVRNLESFRLYIPSTELLEIFMGTQNWQGSPIYQNLSNFGLVVGHLQQRLISRVPHDLQKGFVKMPKCLKYTNGEGDTKVIARALKHANALFLERHWTVQSLSAFGLAEIEKLKFCLLAECNEMVEIVNGSFLKDYPLRSVLGSLEHLSIHYMKSLTCILNGPIDSVCLPNLKTLALHTCPELSTIFTQGLLESLTCLEYLIVKDCAKIKSLVSSESYQSTSTPCFPSLKKISLLHLPELVSISRGISIAPRLESLVVYNCPNLEKLPYIEAFDHIKEIKGKNEWWDGLKWCEPEWTSGQPDYLANVFVPLGKNGEIVDELADAVNLLSHLSN